MATTHSEVVRPEWVDYNGHMNVAYYVLVFDHATDVVLDTVNLGEAYRNATDRSTFVVESHVTYQAESHQGDTVRVESRVLGAQGKKIHLFHRMTTADGETTVATNEILLLHVDLASRRTMPIPDRALDALRALVDADARTPPPTERGRAVLPISGE